MHGALQRLSSSSCPHLASKTQSLAECRTKAAGTHDSPWPGTSLETVLLSISFVGHKVGVFCVGMENNDPKPLLPQAVPGYMLCYKIARSKRSEPKSICSSLHMAFSGQFFPKNCSLAGRIKRFSFSSKAEKYIIFFTFIQCTMKY